MANRLAAENSPYLLQHADNPVDWYPWGPEAWHRAAREDKPIFLSIGYSACHWCHVMAHESFEDREIAARLNENFVCIKVDREERPELDQLYMEAVQIISGHGGWPMSVFLTPELEPFFGGTYWPPRPHGGLPGFDHVLSAVVDVWRNRRQAALDQARQLTQLLQDDLAEMKPAGPVDLGPRVLEAAENSLRRAFDRTRGGFGGPPKFPPSMSLRLLLRRWQRHSGPDALQMVTTTLDCMAAGGMYDQLGGGFHRYSVDAQWLVPHFEKMLYDNALLAQCYLEAWQATGHADYARIVQETLDYVLRDMTDPLGGFYSAEDADSEGEEGLFYLWTPTEVAEVIAPERADVFNRFYDVTEGGNFEGRSILNRPGAATDPAQAPPLPPGEGRGEGAPHSTSTTAYPHSTSTAASPHPNPLRAPRSGRGEGISRPPAPADDLAADRAQLLAARSRRERPLCDDKVLVSWNGLMIEALARAGSALGQPRYVEAAARAAHFLLDQCRDTRGRLLHYWRAGRAQGDAYLDDFASLTNALISLYEAQFDERWINEALGLAHEIMTRFADAAEGGFFYAAVDHQPLIARRKEIFDSSIPSSSGLAMLALLRLGKLCGCSDLRAAAEKALAAALPLAQRAPTGAAQILLALDICLGPTAEIVILAEPDAPATSEVLAALRRKFIPNKVVALRPAHAPAASQSTALAAIFAGKAAKGPEPTVFICQNFACQAPVSGRDAVLAALETL